MSGFYSNGENFDRIFFTEHQLIDRFIGNRAFGVGSNGAGSLGDGTTTNRSVFVDLSGVGSNWKQVSRSSGVKTDGTLWTWGFATTGMLGDGTTTSRSSPNTTSGGGTDWMEVSAGDGFMAAIKLDGTLWTWGDNSEGELGTGTTTNRSSPGTTIAGGGNWLHVAASVAGVTAGTGHCIAVKADGTLWSWGNNGSGQLGNGNTTNRSSPGTTTIGGYDWAKVAAGGNTSAAIKNDGTLWTWGKNSATASFGAGVLGDGTTTNRSSPGTVVGGGTTWKQISLAHSNGMTAVAVKIDGTLWTWGNNAGGQLGDGTTTNRSSPVTTVGGGTNWKSAFCSYSHTMGVKTDGSLWAWGRNNVGQLGDGTTTSRSSPNTIVGVASEWQQIFCGGGSNENIISHTYTGWNTGIAYFV